MILPSGTTRPAWYYQVIQSRYGFNPHHLMLADGIEFFIGQGRKVGLGGHLMGQKVTEQVAEMRQFPAGIDQRSPARHPDWLGPDDLSLKEPGDPRGHGLPGTDPAQVRRCTRLRRRAHGGQVRAGHHLFGRSRGRYRRRPAHRDRGDRHSAHGRHPRGAARARGRRSRRRDRPRRQASRTETRGRSRSAWRSARRRSRSATPPSWRSTATRRSPASPTTRARSACPPASATTATPDAAPSGSRPRIRSPKEARRRGGFERVYNFLTTPTMELQMLARACGKTNVRSLEPEDLAALTIEASAMARCHWLERTTRSARPSTRFSPRSSASRDQGGGGTGDPG